MSEPSKALQEALSQKTSNRDYSSLLRLNRQIARSKVAKTPAAPATIAYSKPCRPSAIASAFVTNATTPTKTVKPPSALPPAFILAMPKSTAAKPKRIFAHASKFWARSSCRARAAKLRQPYANLHHIEHRAERNRGEA